MKSMDAVLDIGSRRELFVDRFLLDALDGVAFRLHHPQPATPPARPEIHLGPVVAIHGAPHAPRNANRDPADNPRDDWNQ